MMVKELLTLLDFGNSVAEFDADLQRYFVETPAFHAIVAGKSDIIAGDKGTGKTALYKVLQARYRQLSEFRGVEILPAFNPAGNPVFQRLGQMPTLTEGQYGTIWKSYLVSLAGNWLLEIFRDGLTDNMRQLENLLVRVALRSEDDSAQTIFSKLTNRIMFLLRPRSAELGLSLTETGMPVLKSRVEYGAGEERQATIEVIPHERLLHLLNECLGEVGATVWVVLDRLDEAFQGYPAVEIPALRALLRTYLDLLEFDRLKLKLFVRKDLFRRVVQGGFVNLTHVNARRLDLVWDEEDLRSLLARRIRDNSRFIDALDANTYSDTQLFSLIFPPQVDVGERKPTTWAWMMSRIRDGNNIRPPRNLIDLARKAQEAQQRAEERQAREYAPSVPLIEPDAIRRALRRLSEDRVNDTLLAEAADLAPLIESFRDGKAEHNITSLSKLLELPEVDVRIAVKPLVELGFLGETGGSYKVPMLYRDGLQITQGKAFSSAGIDEEASDEE